MGQEALSKVLRRDIRRAYAPEASQEVLKFVDSVRQELAMEQAAQHNVNASLREVDQLLVRRVAALEQQAVPATHTFGQRLRWLWSGTWAR
jgi:hypothetical protein